MNNNIKLHKALTKAMHEYKSKDYDFMPKDPEPWKVMTIDEVNDPNRTWVKVP